jgi:prepilin-type N-terminal cleavage/methylation domain-containing protein
MKFSRPSLRRGFTLVEIMVVVAIIALLASLGLPNYLRARKRAQAARILNDLRLIDSAISQYAIETKKAPGSDVVWSDVQPYIKLHSSLYDSGGADLLGNSFGVFSVDSTPQVPAATFAVLSDVTAADFWSPYK